MKKLIKFMIFIIVLVVLYFIYDYFTTIGYKNVKYAELEVFKQDVLNEYNVDEIEIYFSRPSLWIEINSEEKLNELTIEKIKEKLKPIINKENMDEISNKYWDKDSSLFYVMVLFNEKNDKVKTNYLEIELSKNAGYSNWDR
ncbi:MAG: hypothetical protein Q4B23_04915 [Helcococcus sp.]|nr:hypothetical protein [Helcococcus sp.]